MFTCTKEGCDEDATHIVRLKVGVEGSEEPAEVFASIYACSEEHRASDGDIHLFFRNTWEVLVAGFEVHHLPRPIIEKTEFAWVPMAEWEQFKKDYAAADGACKGRIWSN